MEAKVIFNILTVYTYNFIIGLCHKGELAVKGGRRCLFNKATLDSYMPQKFCDVQYLTLYFFLSDQMYNISTVYVTISATTKCLLRKRYRQKTEGCGSIARITTRQQMPRFWLNAGVCM